MDVLSSQANIAGYKAVMLAANEYGRFMPMLMTAAGTVKAARVLIMGVGVAGLQAIATAKRLGAVIEASDVRPPVKEQVESLGAKFIDVPLRDRRGTQDRRRRRRLCARRCRPTGWRARPSIMHERCKLADIVITTALIPGRPAPVLIKDDDGRGDEARLGDRRPGGRAGRQLSLAEPSKTVIEAWRARSSASQSGGAGRGRRVRALRAQRAQLPRAVARPKTGEFDLDRDDEIVAATLVCATAATQSSVPSTKATEHGEHAWPSAVDPIVST